jgi:hypothetical protein
LHLLLLEPGTCARHQQPLVLADIVTDPAERQRVARTVVEQHQGTAQMDAPYFRLVSPDPVTEAPSGATETYAVPLVGGGARLISLASSSTVHASVVVQADYGFCHPQRNLGVCIFIGIVVLAVAAVAVGYSAYYRASIIQAQAMDLECVEARFALDSNPIPATVPTILEGKIDDNWLSFFSPNYYVWYFPSDQDHPNGFAIAQQEGGDACDTKDLPPDQIRYVKKIWKDIAGAKPSKLYICRVEISPR